MSKIRTHYDNLKIARNAPDSLIRAAYKVLLQQHHPDKAEGAKQQDALRITHLIRESYDVLSDPIKRAEHDRWIKEQESGKSEFKYNEKQSYQKQENHDAPQVPIENNSGCFWIIGMVIFCFWIFSDDDESSTTKATEVRQEQFVAPPLSKSYEVVQEKIVAPPLPKNDIELLDSAKELLKQKQFEAALTIYRNLAESNNLAVQAEAQNELGVRYSEGAGVTQSYSIAMLWFQKSANQKYAGAEYNLGWLYEKGLGVQKDYAMAIFWYQKATDHGYSTEHSKNALIHLNSSNANPSMVEDMEQLPAAKEATLVEQSELRQLSQNWIIAHSSKDIAAFSDLYDDFVLFYGTKMNRNSTLEAKLKLFKKYPDLQQQIYGDIQFEKQTDGTIKSSFTKRVRVTITQKTTDYPAYLISKKSNNSWKITVESDLVTDKNIAKKSNSSNGVDIPKNAIRGDFNGDGNLEYMWMIPPKLKEVDGFGDCEESICENQIKFSNPSIPTIKIKSSIGGNLSNLGDLNKNGTDEVGLLSFWFTSCWQPFYVWTNKNGNWVNAVESIDTHCNQWDKGIKPIEIDQANEGNVIIRYSSHDDGFVVKSKSVKIIK